MPSAITSVGGIQGGTPPPYTNAPGLSPRQAQNIMQQLRSGAGLAQPSQAAAQGLPQSNMTPLAAGAQPMQQAMMSRLAPGGMGATATPQSTISPLPAGTQMGGFAGFGGMSPIQPGAYAQPAQARPWGPNPFAFAGT